MNDTTNKTITLPVKVLLVAGELFIAAGAGFSGGAFSSSTGVFDQTKRLSAVEVQLGAVSKEFDKEFAHGERERSANSDKIQANARLLSSLLKMSELDNERCKNFDERLRYIERKMK